MRNIIIDTDIGDDADDILALALALKSSELNIVGVTTVFKNTQLRAKMAKHVLALAERQDIPVFAGHPHSILGENDCTEVPCQYQSEMSNYSVPEVHAVQYIADVLSTQKVTLVAIGPLTNIADLIVKHPECLKNIEELVVMGGCYYRHVNEWNIVCDPEAADIVFRSGLKIRAVGLDVTTQCNFNGLALSSARRDADTPLKKLLIESCDAWFNETGFTPILHDPLTIFSLLSDSDIEYVPENVRVELKGEFTRAMTVCTEEGIWGRVSESPTALVARHLDADNFVNYFTNKVFSN
ncbi:nucleoside hydrolase [Vibrio aestuarianus]|uniref:nucleoside hydrolase n=1 Tax=Vibrio aestuarianus TaxID=28171 RepID=UPI00237CB377|nr:nucleoside hydrolase [Vibrio aestuarianus]MDE1230085.1 nucleoside hydrolase [Vibrio aestuarianus]MDE1264958.1 nucleoside hydrolase [Vibrio aestuarianus]MDE1296886.1 nucleoside hydrolase [Vibrio aestuarianus]MDE1328385.1 nucleoside hydrolase [Vibrio aestuarianus]